VRIPCFVALLVCATACKEKAPPGGGGGGGQRPPPDVTVVTLATEHVALKTELPGRTVAALTSEVRPQITGVVKSRLFQEGAEVKAGQVLYQIDSAPYRAAFLGAQADLASAKSSLEAAKLKDQRYASLLGIQGVAQQAADDARLAHQQATANVAQKSAALEAARINLAYTSIRAPIAGRIGTSAVTVGALVTANQPAPLATIRSLDPIYADVVESTEQRLRLRSQLEAGKLEAGSTEVKLVLPDGTTYAHAGTLEFAEVAVDAATGTVTLRAKFPNPDATLLPGMYVRAVLDEAIDQNAILAPQRGVSHDPKGNATAMVVGPDDKVELRTLVATRTIGDRWLVESGLKAGDRLIIEGLNKVGPGMPVHPHEATADAGSGPASAAPPARSGSGSDKPAPAESPAKKP
jgi:membrane fusion protein (multidrug efflux system)